MLNQFLWVIFPYLVFTIFIGGHIFRYNYDQFGWTAKSSELLEKKELKAGSTLFHWGIIFAFLGHVAGILIPKGFYDALGIHEHNYHIIALSAGIPAGLAALIGIVILSHRRLTVKRVKVTSSNSDFASLLFLLLAILSGLLSTFINFNPNGFDYRETIGPWFRSLFIFHPSATIMANEVPLWFQLHILGAFILLAAWPFTRLVHAFSAPFKYLTRSYVVYRKRRPVDDDAVPPVRRQP
jgi:nitrate reductase gamma subunit